MAMTQEPDWADREADMMDTDNGVFHPAHLIAQIADALRRAKADGLREAAEYASLFTVKDDASIYPDVPFKTMTEQAQAISHMTAQNIAEELRDIADLLYPPTAI